MTTPLPPGSTIGILGGGQLGRMLAVAAAQLGYRTHVLAPDRESVAAQTASVTTRSDYHNRVVLADFAQSCDVVTYEFENIDLAPVEWLAERIPVHPHPRALKVAQDRVVEKRFVEGVGGRPARWAEVTDPTSLAAALATVGAPAVLKTARFGYDGKGQVTIRDASETAAAWDAVGGRAVLEAFVDFDCEFSVLIARGADGSVARYDAPVNVHAQAILRTSTVPAPDALAGQIAAAVALAERIAGELDYVGVLACEFFATREGAPVFNEMAPRVHNSGHWTIEGATTSQFENHVRAICGLPLGATTLTGTSVAMENLIGDDGDAWLRVLGEPGAHLHLYGKGTARPGRKMGHLTRVVR